MNIEWITDRLPTAEDCNKSADVVWISGSHIAYIDHWSHVKAGQPWMPITPPEPYVKPKRYCVVEKGPNYYAVFEDDYEGGMVATSIPTREAAERIAAIYEEVMT